MTPPPVESYFLNVPGTQPGEELAGVELTPPLSCDHKRERWSAECVLSLAALLAEQHGVSQQTRKMKLRLKHKIAPLLIR